jgi:hypothetical protein
MILNRGLEPGAPDAARLGAQAGLTAPGQKRLLSLRSKPPVILALLGALMRLMQPLATQAGLPPRHTSTGRVGDPRLTPRHANTGRVGDPGLQLCFYNYPRDRFLVMTATEKAV